MSAISSLSEKYSDFMVPAFDIFVDGSKISKEFGATSLSVTLGMGKAANACMFELQNIYDQKARKILSDISDKFILGKTVKVSIGYGSKLTKVFTGYIDDLSYRFSADRGPVLQVLCLDARALMKHNTANLVNIKDDVKTIVQKMLKSYSPLISSCSLDMPELAKQRQVRIEETDLDFVYNEAEKRDRLFYILDDKVYVEASPSETCVTYEWDSSYTQFSFSMSYLKHTVRTHANQEGMNGFFKDAKALQPAKQSEAVNTPLTTHFRLGEQTQEDAQKIAQSLANTDKRNCQSGTVISIGLPEVMPGKLITIEKFPIKQTSTKDTFVVTAVKHMLNGENFTTTAEFNIGV